MRRLSDRYPLDVTIELYASHRWERMTMQDVSHTGMFVTTVATLSPGTPVVVAFKHGETRVASPARVTHRLGAADARTLGRTPGIGLEFREPYDAAFAEAIEALMRHASELQPS